MDKVLVLVIRVLGERMAKSMEVLEMVKLKSLMVWV